MRKVTAHELAYSHSAHGSGGLGCVQQSQHDSADYHIIGRSHTDYSGHDSFDLGCAGNHHYIESDDGGNTAHDSGTTNDRPDDNADGNDILGSIGWCTECSGALRSAGARNCVRSRRLDRSTNDQSTDAGMVRREVRQRFRRA